MTFLSQRRLVSFLIVGLIACIPFPLKCQDLKGIWNGYFDITQENISNKSIDEFHFELQLNQLNSSEVSGITYSFKTKEYFGKANFIGHFNHLTKELIIQETNLSTTESKSNSDICKLLCTLKYVSTNGKEYLNGTFKSYNAKNNSFCFSGKVRLEKVKKSSFSLESFLKQKPNTKLSYKEIKKKIDSVQKKIIEIDSIKNESEVAISFLPIDSIISNNTEFKPISEFINRENILVSKIRINEKMVSISFYDNGIIDKDTISVLVNGKLVIDKQMVNYKPLNIQCFLNKDNPICEIIAIANNLGEFPPNTALMVIYLKKKRIEIPITSDFRKNAKVLIEFDETKDIQIERF